MAAPIAGTCEVATPATILAMLFPLPLREVAIAVDRPSTMRHHVGVLLLGHTGHLGGEILERVPVCRAKFGKEIDVAAELYQAVPVTGKDTFLLLGAHRESLEIGRLIGFEGFAVFGLHERHAEFV